MMKRSMIALAVMSAVSANAAVMASNAPVYANGTLPPEKTVVDHAKTPLNNRDYMFYTVDQAIELKDLAFDLEVVGKSNTQVTALEITNGATFAGDKLNVTAKTDALGSGNSLIHCCPRTAKIEK